MNLLEFLEVFLEPITLMDTNGWCLHTCFYSPQLVIANSEEFIADSYLEAFSRNTKTTSYVAIYVNHSLFGTLLLIGT